LIKVSIGVLLGSVLATMIWVSLFAFIGEQQSPMECMSGYVTVDGGGPYSQRMIIGDLEICGRDIEVGNITGPSKLYDRGDPL